MWGIFLGSGMVFGAVALALIKMKEAEAHYKNGWVTVQGADAVIADK